jgi:CBS domain containing-hemolysin-like protein
VSEALDFEIEDAHEATISGYVIEQLGRLPVEGEVFQLVEGVSMKALNVGEAHIDALEAVTSGIGTTRPEVPLRTKSDT